MPKKKSHKKNKGSTVNRVKGQIMLSSPTNMSAGGLWVSDRYEIDTSLASTWATLALVYQRWKIHSLTFKFVPLLSTSSNGLCFMAVLEDPESTTPSSEQELMNQRVTKAGGIRFPLTLRWRPRHELWWFTQDNLAQDDRLEMPGDFVFATSAGTASANPGRIFVHYDVSFDLVTNSNVSITKHVDSQVEKAIRRKLEEQLKTLTN